MWPDRRYALRMCCLLIGLAACNSVHPGGLDTAEARRVHLYQYAEEYCRKYESVVISPIIFVYDDCDSICPILLDGLMYYNAHDGICADTAEMCRRCIWKIWRRLVPDAPRTCYDPRSQEPLNDPEVRYLRNWYYQNRDRLAANRELGRYVLRQ